MKKLFKHVLVTAAVATSAVVVIPSAAEAATCNPANQCRSETKYWRGGNLPVDVQAFGGGQDASFKVFGPDGGTNTGCGKFLPADGVARSFLCNVGQGNFYAILYAGRPGVKLVVNLRVN